MRRSVFWLLDQPGDADSLHRRAVDDAQELDALGFDSIWVAEHHFTRLGTAPNPAVLLAAMAARTERVRLGPGVSVLPLRDPLRVAEDYAMVDRLSNGRLNMGVGTGSGESEFAAMGVDFDSRRELFEENLARLLRAWDASTGEPEAGLNILPLQEDVPIYVATLSEEGARAAGRAGRSILTLSLPVADDVEEAIRRVAAHARGLADGGYAPDAAEAVLVVVTFVADDDAEARRLGCPALGRFLSLLAGGSDVDAEAAYDHVRRERLGILGSPVHARETLASYEAMGVEHVAFLSGFGGIDASAARGSLRLLGPESA